MVVLVRCSDDTYTVAMESSLDELTRTGLITAYLQDGEWVGVARERRPAVSACEKRLPALRSAMAVAC